MAVVVVLAVVAAVVAVVAMFRARHLLNAVHSGSLRSTASVMQIRSMQTAVATPAAAVSNVSGNVAGQRGGYGLA